MKDLSPQVKAFAGAYYRSIGTPLAMKLYALLQAREWDAIAVCKADPKDYTDAESYFFDACASALLRKYSDLPTSFDRRGVALSNWRLGEVDCYKTNERLVPYLEGISHPNFVPAVGQHIAGIRRKIRDLLGPRPSIESLQPKHGPGATFSDKSVRATLADKMQSRASLTGGALWYLLDWVGTSWGREALKRLADPVWVRGNRFTTAPKDATKDRPIAAEPSINIFYQLGLGLAVRRRLKLVGIDLDEGQEKHRLMASAASCTGTLATLDLKNASDTVAYNLVKLLLPPGWFQLFDELRSPFTRMSTREAQLLSGREPASSCKHHWVKLEKFSSMGNGFTFELESLLFWAIVDYTVKCVVENPEETLIYGDDIICDSRAVLAVTQALRFFGFTLNKEKSFSEGVFRESCGGDFWEGRPVRPFFLKDPLDEPHKLIAAANQVRRVAFDLFGGLKHLSPTWHAILDQLPSQVRRCRGPESLGDIVVHDDRINWSWTSSAKNRVFCWRPVRYRKVSLRPFADGTILACGLYGVDVSKGWINPRDGVAGYALRKVMVYGVHWEPFSVVPYGPVSETAASLGPRRGPSYDSANLRIVRRERSVA